jgi:hypothetical protein
VVGFEDLALSALELERTAFVAGLPRWFLIVPVENAPQTSARFRTAASDYLKRVAALGDSARKPERSSLQNRRWNQQAWNAEPLAKRSESPYSDRISVGRAPNVDVMIRSPFVSKLHAHLAIAAGQDPTVTDLESQNGTFVEGARLEARKSVTISNGSSVSFGQVHCELATSDVVYYALRRKYRRLFESSKGDAG